MKVTLKIFFLLFIMFDSIDLRAIECSSLIYRLDSFQNLRYQEKKLLGDYHYTMTALKVVHAIVAENLLPGAKFKVVQKGGDNIEITSPWEAMSLLYTANPNSIVNIEYQWRGGHNSLYPLSEFFEKTLRDRYSDSIGDFYRELANHLENTRGLSRLRDEFFLPINTNSKGLWDFLKTGVERKTKDLLRLSSQSGHRTHPLYKMRTNVERGIIRSYMPEAGQDFTLRVYAVDKKNVDLVNNSLYGDVDEMTESLFLFIKDGKKNWQNELSKIDKKADEYMPLLVHPLQANLIADEINDLENLGVLIPLNLQTHPFIPTMSFRTLEAINNHGRLKLPLSMQMTSVQRHHAPLRVKMGPIISQRLQELYNHPNSLFSGHLQIVPETFGVSLKEGFGKKHEYGLNMLLRKDPHSLIENTEIALELNSLFENANSPKSLFEQIMRDKGITHRYQAKEYFYDYAQSILDATLGSFLRYGISFEAHQQNTMLVFDKLTADFKKILIQDLAGGVEIYRPIFEIADPDAKNIFSSLQKALFDDLSTPLSQEVHTTFVSHLLPVTTIISKAYGVDQKELLAILKGVIDELFKKVDTELVQRGFSATQLNKFKQFHHQVYESLIHRDYPVKSLLTMRLKQQEQRINNFMSNPFANIEDVGNTMGPQTLDLSAANDAVGMDQLIERLIRSNQPVDSIVSVIEQTPFFQNLLLHAQGTVNITVLLGEKTKNTGYIHKRNQVLQKLQEKLNVKEFGVAYNTLSLDERIHRQLKTFRVSSLPAPPKDSDAMIKLGQELFHDPILSGNKNISCHSCHQASLGTSDNLPLSLGHGALDLEHGRIQADGVILRRNAPALFNLGQPDITTMFWDGRVRVTNATRQVLTEKHGMVDIPTDKKVLMTPEPGLNGEKPRFKHIVKVLSEDALATQALFPIVSREEMRGFSGNELAEATSNYQAWQGVVDRLVGDRQGHYVRLFNEAYPGLRRRKVNIGHVGKALSSFMRHQFDVRQTPFDRYLAGNLQALSAKEKLGLDVFLNKGKCIACHSGPHLGSNFFTSVGTPHIQPEGEIVDDLGRFEVTGRDIDRYRFKAPSLRNTALNASVHAQWIIGNTRRCR